MYKILCISFIAACFWSCQKDGPDTQSVDLRIRMSHALTLLHGQIFPHEQVRVQLTNLRNNNQTEIAPDASGTLVFEGIMPGEYSLQAFLELDRSAYTALTGVDPGAEVNLNAAVSQLNVPAGFAETLELSLVSGKPGSFVIKQVYFAGSDNRDGAIFRDQFIEIHNNTSDVLYADGFYIARLWGKQDPADARHHLLPAGQFDWSKSSGISMGMEANTEYVYLRDLFRVPGAGQEYPIQPGESFIIAQNALNHKIPFTGNNGREVSVRNPDLTIDLSGADFEVYFGDLPGRTPFATDIDNPAVPNMEVLTYAGNDWILDAPGRDAYVLIEADDDIDMERLPEHYAPLLTEPGPSASKYLQLPNRLIMDAVEIQPNLPTDRPGKKLLPAFDAGFTYVPEGSYSSQAVIRKTASNAGGRRILKDTNNSNEDFIVIKASPKGFAD